VSTPEVQRTIEAVWRLEAPKVIAGLTRMVRDLSLAEDLAHDALVAALEQWPAEGIPRNPGAWLMAAGKHRAIDQLRRRTRLRRKHEQLARELDNGRPSCSTDLDAAMDDDIGDDLLRLIFTACHPVLSTEARVALTLRLLGGLTTEEIARAFLTPEPTIAQRIVRAKRTLAKANVPFEVPRRNERQERLAPVLEVLYLIFNEGYSATAGEDWVRPTLCDEALRLGRVLAGMTPDEPEVHGLVALMELQSSRLRARVGPNGEAVRLLDQNRARWDRLLIGRGLAALERAERLTAEPGLYHLQAAIASCHARATVPAETDWTRIAHLYAKLVAVTASPIVRLNHAVAVGMAAGPAAGLALVEALMAEGALDTYQYAPSVRGDLLEKLGRHSEARAEFERAARLTKNARERDLLRARAAACGPPAG
jgi:RNA polymerase sigma factor (sigma-70 family)